MTTVLCVINCCRTMRLIAALMTVRNCSTDDSIPVHAQLKCLMEGMLLLHFRAELFINKRN